MRNSNTIALKRWTRKMLVGVMTLVCCLWGSITMAQTAAGYTFTATTGGALNSMAGSTLLIAASSDDGTSGVQAIGFPFNYEGTNYTQFSASVNGLVRLGATGVTGEFTNSFASGTNVPKLMPSWDDHHTGNIGGGGQVHTVLLGSSPNQIRVIEWFVTIPRSTTGAANARFQCWLYEGTNVVEYRYGTSGGNTASASYGVGGLASSNFVSVNTSTLVSSNVTASNTQTVWPGNGTVFTFAPPPPCPLYTIPLSEGFNGGSSPTCWTQQFVVGSSSLNFLTTSANPTTAPFEGSHFVRWNSFSISSNNSTRLVSPGLITTGTASVDVNFRWFNENNPTYTDLAEGVQVDWSLDGVSWTAAGSFVPRHDPSLAANTGLWNLKTVTLPSGAGNQPTIYVGFRFVSRFGDNASLDAVNVVASPACTAPSTVTAAATGPFSGSISWSAVSGAVDYIYEVRSSGACGSGPSGLISSDTTTSTSATLTGLNDNTTYTVCVSTNCGSQVSGYNSATFVTPFVQPANDTCAGAIPIICGGSVSGNTTAATTDTGLPTCGSTSSFTNGMWYSITPTISGNVTLSLCTGTSFDTYLRVYDGACNALSCIASNDDFCGLQSQVTFLADADSSYFVLVSGFGTSSIGAFTLSYLAPSPSAVTAINAPASLLCNENGVFSATSAAGLSYNWSTDNGSVVAGQGSSSATIAWGTGSGTVTLVVSNSCGDSDTLTSTNSCVPGPCSNVTTVSCGSSNTTTLSAGPSAYSPGNCGFATPGQEVVYSFTATYSGGHILSVDSASGTDYFDYFFKAASSGCGSTGWTCIDDLNAVGNSTAFNLTAGTTYYILVDKENFQSDTTTGTQVWSITCPIPPANDDCSNAIAITGSTQAFSNQFATGTDITSCTLGDVNDVWFSWVAPYCGQVTFNTCGPLGFDTGLSLWNSCTSGLELACNDDFCGLQSSITVTVSAGDTYYLRVAGYNGAQGSGVINVIMTPQLSSSAVVTSSFGCGNNVSCNGATDGAVDLTVSGGVTPYSFLWSNGAVTEDLSGVGAGSYTVTVTDLNNCTSVNTVNVAGPATLTMTCPANVTVTRGYTPTACATLAVTNIAGGCAPYSIVWSTGATTASISVCPTVATSYTVTVTDANGCSNTCAVQVCVNDVRCGNNLQKVLICHQPPCGTGPQIYQTTCMPASAVANWLLNNPYDYVGACFTNVPCGTNKDSQSGAEAGNDYAEAMIEAFPNPFNQTTTVRFMLPVTDMVNINVFSLDGRHVATLFNDEVEAGIAYVVDFDAKDAAEGIYFARMTQSSGEVRTLKLVVIH